MLPGSKRHFYLGVNFLLAPSPNFGVMEFLRFQQVLAEPKSSKSTIVFDAVQPLDAAKLFSRGAPPLQVRLGPAGPQIAQLLLTAPQPQRLLQDFIDDCDCVIEAYRQVWPGEVQVVRRDCTVRHLYAVREPHAFQYLWERRLRQPAESLAALNRPVLGGGLRLFMHARPDLDNDPTVEVKIESLFADSSQLFVEATFVWPKPAPSSGLDAGTLVNAVENYLNNEVCNFILGSE